MKTFHFLALFLCALALSCVCACTSSNDDDTTPLTQEIRISDITGHWQEISYLKSDGKFHDVSEADYYRTFCFEAPNKFSLEYRSTSTTSGVFAMMSNFTWTFNAATQTAHLEDPRENTADIAFSFENTNNRLVATLTIKSKSGQEDSTCKAVRISETE